MEPHPTSYRNVVLKSKSEAVFIHALELGGFTHWEYEPERFRVDEWVPDFWIVGSFFDKKKQKRIVMSVLVEYKPGPVTSSYRQILARRFAAINATSRPDTVLCLLICGTAFDPTIPRTAEWFNDGQWVAAPDFFLKHLDEARSFRFDLQPL